MLRFWHRINAWLWERSWEICGMQSFMVPWNWTTSLWNPRVSRCRCGFLLRIAQSQVRVCATCENCVNEGPFMNCMNHMRICNVPDIFLGCNECSRVLCNNHMMRCYCQDENIRAAILQLLAGWARASRKCLNEYNPGFNPLRGGSSNYRELCFWRNYYESRPLLLLRPWKLHLTEYNLLMKHRSNIF